VPAAAHPHVFVTANGELLFDAEGRIRAIGNVWQFDDAFSAFAIEGLDANQNGKYDDAELQPLAKINVESLLDFGFFTHLAIDGKEQAFVLPTEYWLEYDGSRLTLFFTLPLDLPIAPGKETTLEIFDPEYFVAFEFPGEHPLSLSGAPDGCTATYHPPQGLDDQTMAILNSLPMDQRQLPPDLQAAADKLADAYSIDCPAVEVAAAASPPPEASRPTAKSPFGIATPDGGSGMTVGGPFGPAFAWIAARQAEFYKGLTDTLGDIKENGSAVWLLLAIAFLYGVFHAAGPGHGKAVITSYVLASGDTVKRGIAISFAAAFVQALSAIVIVGVATLIVGATAQQMTGVTDWLEIASYAAIVLLGLWLVWLKTFGGGHHHHHHHHFPMPAGAGAGGGHDHHDHDHHGHGHTGHDHGHAHQPRHGHAHGRHHHGEADVLEAPPTVPQDLDALSARRAATAAAVVPPATAASAPPPSGNWLTRAWSAILAVGIRPCSGAIIILVFALSQGLLLAGIAATFVMALGTGLTVAILATIAVSAKGLAMRFADAESGRGATVLRIVEIGGAFAVLIFGVLLLGGALYPMM
jgi:ABC-type nickel/cobalt efflux system permease component RcnA/ABC-type uncharacterized transport system substrate-binding protein